MNYKTQIVHQIEWKIDYLKEHHDRCAYDRLIGFLDCALLASVITVEEYGMYYDTAMNIYYDMGLNNGATKTTRNYELCS